MLQIGESVFPASLEAGPAAEALETLRAGTIVDVTGVYAYQWGPSPSFRLFLRSAGDVKVIEAAPWWTLRHTAVMIAILALGACATGGLDEDGGEAPPAAISGGADRAQPGGA